MAKYSKRQYSTLICSICGNRMVIPRRQSRQRKEGHIKTLYCGICAMVTDFVENNTRTMYEKEEREDDYFQGNI